jgi:hypothetical protein
VIRAEQILPVIVSTNIARLAQATIVSATRKGQIKLRRSAKACQEKALARFDFSLPSAHFACLCRPEGIASGGAFRPGPIDSGTACDGTIFPAVPSSPVSF